MKGLHGEKRIEGITFFLFEKKDKTQGYTGEQGLEIIRQLFSGNAVDTWDKYSNAFLVKFFPMGKINALHNKISSFQQLADESILEAWE